MKAFIKENRSLILFLGKLILLCSFYFFWFEKNVWHTPILSTLWGYIVHYTALNLTTITVAVLEILGYGAETTSIRAIDLYDSETGIYVANVCLGLDMMYTLSALVISYPGSWMKRLWFIPTGMVGIFTINVIRIIGLSMAVIFLGGEEFGINHQYFNIASTLFIFGMFVIWVRINKKGEPA